MSEDIIQYGKQFSPIEHIKQNYPEIILIDGYDDCIVGIVDKIGNMHCACYNTFKILHKLEEQGMSSPEADEYFAFNILGAYLGEYTPCFIEILN